MSNPISFFLIFHTVLTFAVNGHSGVWLKKIYSCDLKADYVAIINVTVSSNNNKQYADGTIIVKKTFDNNVWSNVTVEILAGNYYVYLFSIIERKACEAMHKYFGEFIYDVERSAQLIPGMCPILPGKYQLHNFMLNYEKITTLANFPFGTLRLTFHVYLRNNINYSCFVFEVENNSYF